MTILCGFQAGNQSSSAIDAVAALAVPVAVLTLSDPSLVGVL